MFERDTEFIQRIRHGDEGALAHIYEVNYPMVENLALKNSGGYDDAKDLYQDAIVVFYKNVIRTDFVLSSTIKTYIYAIAWKLWMKRLRDEKRMVITQNEDLVVEEFDFELLNKPQDSEISKVVDLLQKHGKNCLEILKRIYFHNQSFDQIALSLGYASGQVVREQKYRCIKRVRRGIKSIQ